MASINETNVFINIEKTKSKLLQKSMQRILTNTEKVQIRQCRSCAVHERVSYEAWSPRLGYYAAPQQ